MPVTTIVSDPRDKYSADLYNSLGAFWTRLYSDHEFINLKCKGDALVAAQTYLNLVEASACLALKDIPIFHRERWFPLVIRKSERNTGASVRLHMGINPPAVIGPQPETTAYTPNQEFYIGGPALKHGFTVYPAHGENFHSGLLSVCSSVLSPKTTYLLNVDYYIDRGGIVFKSELDPFTEDSNFIKRNIKNASGVEDTEIVLWGTDAYIDRGYVRDHFGYLQTVDIPEQPVYQASAVDAVLRLRGGGSNLMEIVNSLGKLFVTPVVQYDDTIDHVYVNSDGATFVITKTACYKCRPEETLLPEIVAGASITRGKFLTGTVKFYRKLNPDKFKAFNGYSLEQFVADVPRLSLHKGLIHGQGLTGGIIVDWKDTPLTFHGDDLNGHPKLKFDLGVGDEAQAAYWSHVWARAESGNEDMAEILNDSLTLQPPYAKEGMVVGSVNPMRFFMKNCLNSNTSVLVVDFDGLPEYIKAVDLLYELNKATPAHTIILMIAKKSITETTYDLVTATDIVTAGPGHRVTDTCGEGTGFLAYKDFGIKYKWVTRGAK